MSDLIRKILETRIGPVKESVLDESTSPDSSEEFDSGHKAGLTGKYDNPHKKGSPKYNDYVDGHSIGTQGILVKHLVKILHHDVKNSKSVDHTSSILSAHSEVANKLGSAEYHDALATHHAATAKLTGEKSMREYHKYMTNHHQEAADASPCTRILTCQH